MTEMRIGDQTVRYDRGATVVAYEALEYGFAEECGCIFCRNFAAQRIVIYPVSFRALLEQLGIDPNKEGEAFEYGPVEDARHLHGGWFYLAGEMVTEGERNYKAPDAHHFDFFFTTAQRSDAQAFRISPMLAIEFTVHAKRVVAESDDSGRRPAVRPV